MSDNTKVVLKRSNLLIPGLDEQGDENTPTLTKRNKKLTFGEPMFIDNTGGTSESKCRAYIAVGPDRRVQGEEETEVRKSILFKGFSSKEKADSLVFYDKEKNTITDESGNAVAVSKVNPKKLASTDLDKNSTIKYHILCVADDGSDEAIIFDLENAGIYINGNAVMNGAAWNDYAEYRWLDEELQNENLSGKVLCEVGDGTLNLSSEKLQPCSYVVSDTYGISIGHGNVPIAVSGKALVYIKEKDKIKIGDCVAADKNGYATIMTREEIALFPDRILGIVTEIPTYDHWKDIEVDGRVWIKIK